MKITEALLAEHHVFHNLFDHIERVAPRLRTLAEIRALAAATESMLTAHSKTEDDLFIAPLEPSFEQIGHCDTFHHEHDLIEQNLALVHKTKAVREARHLLLTTVLMCRSHFDKEERIVFPMAEQILKSKTLVELGDTWMNQRNKSQP
ncbi:MAG TPA: hemerythrin domain-containing protein [Candidatus Paceibacterota bacterium]|nr:hemerythrin domain-containing protein [Candidatus Paceibacterota bacterium]